MAGFALGGIEIAIRSTRHDAETCAHSATLNTISSGIERVVCEECGHLSIRFHRTMSGPIERDSFSRPADEMSAIGKAEDYASPMPRYAFGSPKTRRPEVFAHRPHMQLQPRFEREDRLLTLRG